MGFVEFFELIDISTTNYGYEKFRKIEFFAGVFEQTSFNNIDRCSTVQSNGNPMSVLCSFGVSIIGKE